MCRDDVQHSGRRIDWGSWAVCRDDWAFQGTGNLKQGASYDPAPGQLQICMLSHIMHLSHGKPLRLLYPRDILPRPPAPLSPLSMPLILAYFLPPLACMLHSRD